MKLSTRSQIKRVIGKFLGYRRMLYYIARFRIRTGTHGKKHAEFSAFLNLAAQRYAQNPKASVLDIGANIGVTAYFLSLTCPDAVVHAYEPVPDNISVLHRVTNHYRLSNVNIYPYGLGSEEGTVSIAVPVINGVKQHTRATLSTEEQAAYDVIENQDVEIKCLDRLDYLKDEVIALKIDVEGHEYFVLQGGKELIKKHRPVIFCETGDGFFQKKVFQWVEDQGYRIEVFHQGRLHPFDRQTRTPDHGTVNYFFIPQGR